MTIFSLEPTRPHCCLSSFSELFFLYCKDYYRVKEGVNLAGQSLAGHVSGAGGWDVRYHFCLITWSARPDMGWCLPGDTDKHKAPWGLKKHIGFQLLSALGYINIFWAINFDIFDLLIQSINLEPTYSIYKCIHIHSLQIHWGQIIYKRNVFLSWRFPFAESNQESEIELISLHYSSVPPTFLLMFSIIQAPKLLRTSDPSKHRNFFIDHKR